MTITRYAYDFLDGLNADKDGLLVSYSDYLALAEQVRLLTEQRDAVVAEASVMLRLITNIRENHVEYLSEGEDCMMAGVPLDYVSEINMYVSRDVNAENPFPSIDSIHDFLRAEGVEMFAKHCDDSIGFIEPEDEELYTLMEEQARKFARQLRESKGATS